MIEIIVRLQNKTARPQGEESDKKRNWKENTNNNDDNNNTDSKQNNVNVNVITNLEYEVKCPETWAWYPAKIVGFDKINSKFRVRFENEFSMCDRGFVYDIYSYKHYKYMWVELDGKKKVLKMEIIFVKHQEE